MNKKQSIVNLLEARKSRRQIKSAKTKATPMLKRPKSIGMLMSYAEIEKRFDSEWVLLENPETTKMLKVKRGKLLWHSKDRDEVHRKAFTGLAYSLMARL
jgi:hypothetical protein